MPGRLEHCFGLSERRAGSGRLTERKMQARELEPDADGFPRNAVVEHGPQAVGTCQRHADTLRPRLVERDTRRRDVHDRGRRVVAESRLYDERFCRPCMSRCLAPGSFPRSEERELRLRQEDLLDAAGFLRPLDGCTKLHHGTIGLAEEEVRNASARSAVGTQKLSGGS